VGTHYESLGVSPTADTPTIRAAYLAKARVHHPDRNLDAAPAARARAARSMREANAAWAVLGDPVARRGYDSSLAAANRAAASRSAPRPTEPVPPRRVVPPQGMPPRAEDDELDLHDRVGCGVRVIPMVAILVLLLGIFVYTAFAASKGEDVPRTTVSPGDLAAGDCVVGGPVLKKVACATRHDAVVVAVVSGARGCPIDTSVFTIDVSRVACLRAVP
jgi:hypothetical protein